MSKKRKGKNQPSSRRGMATDDRLLVSRRPEPALVFGQNQTLEDPRDGLILFGPLDKGRPYGIRAGVIGTSGGIELFRSWVHRVQGRLIDKGDPVARPPFPGFETVFRIPWGLDPVITIQLGEQEIMRAASIASAHPRVYTTVGVYATPILASLDTEDPGVDVWFVIIPDIVHTNCRPKSRVPPERAIQSADAMSAKWGKRLVDEPSMFAEDNVAATPYHYEIDFHNQLKARLLGRAPTQIIRESTLYLPPKDVKIKRNMTGFQAAIAWNICTAAFYKAGGRPWKLSSVRDGVCYVGLVFKQDHRHPDPRYACCAAQMFLDSGDGLVFRGAAGPWYSAETEEFHLTADAATELAELVVKSYAESHGREPPRELFIHARAYFNDEEWTGFTKAIDPRKTRIVGIRIRHENGFKAFRPGDRPVLRGTVVRRHHKAAYLFTSGYNPRLRTYVGREVPRPLRIDVLRGDIELETVLQDIMSLTKLNYNSCLYSDGMPVTLRFADRVGEILTAGPVPENRPLQFKHYV